MNRFLRSLTGLAVAAAGATGHARPFKDFVWPYLEDYRIKLPPTEIFEGGDALRDVDVGGDARLRTVLALYENDARTALKAKGPLTWKAERLPSPLFLPRARPLPVYFDDHLIWAFAGKTPVAMYRPVDTTTDCDTGCTPVVFHLRYLPKAEVPSRILEESEWPLRKAFHEEFTATDKRKLLDLVKKLPAGLALIEHPSRLTNADQSFPPQTWTVHAKFLVRGAAYTSYRVYEAALKTRQALRKLATDASHAAIDVQRNDWLVSIMEVRDAKAADAFLRKSLAEMDSPRKIPELRALIGKVLPYLAFYAGEEQKSAGPISALAANRTLRDYFQTDLCQLARNLLTTPQGRQTLLALPKDRGLCAPDSDRTTTFLAMSAEGKTKDELKVYFAAHHLPVLPPPGVLADARQLGAYVEALGKFMERSELVKVYADLLTRFPKESAPFLAKLNPDEKKLLERDLSEAEKKFREELSRKLEVAPRAEFPKLTFLNNTDGGFRTFDPGREGKQIIVFFASWCPHCQQTVKNWMGKEIAAQLDRTQAAEFWRKTQFIEVFGRGNPTPDEFCGTTGMPKEQCAKILRVDPESTQAKILTEKLSLLGVPRVMVLDAQGGVALNRFDVNDADESTVLRNLLWLTQAL